MQLTPKKGDTIAVWFSCGAASAVAAKITLDKWGGYCNIRVINNPIKEEDEDNQRFLKDVERWLGIEIEEAKNPKYPNASIVEVFNEKKYMSGVAGAPCTGKLKKEARSNWEQNNHFDWIVLGFTSDEEKRLNDFRLTERSNVLGVLVDSNITKSDCFMILMEAGIQLPAIYHRGYPNANCIGCVKAQSPTYWNLVRREDPDVFQERLDQSRRIGAKLVKAHPKHLPFCYQEGRIWFDSRTGEQLTKVEKKNGGNETYVTNPLRIFLDELPVDAVGGKLKDLNFECGIFCEDHFELERMRKIKK